MFDYLFVCHNELFFIIKSFYFSNENQISFDFNNVISSYSIVPFLLALLLKNKFLKVLSILFINLVLLISLSKTGWLILLFNTILIFSIIKYKYKLYLAILLLSFFYLFQDKILDKFYFKLSVSGFFDSSNHGHFYDRLDIFEIALNYLIDTSIYQFLFGYNFNSIYSYLNDYFSNSGFFHSSYLEVLVILGFLGLICYVIFQITYAYIISKAFKNNNSLFIYLIFILSLLSFTSSNFIRYYPFQIMFLICLHFLKNNSNHYYR